MGGFTMHPQGELYNLTRDYDDSIVRQMVECIKVYADKHIEVIFGGGYTVEETVE